MLDTNTMNGPEAKLRYGDGDFDVLRPGAYVTCAVTGKPIPLEELRYWSVSRQEAYADAEATAKAYAAALEAGEKF